MSALGGGIGWEVAFAIHCWVPIVHHSVAELLVVGRCHPNVYPLLLAQLQRRPDVDAIAAATWHGGDLLVVSGLQVHDAMGYVVVQVVVTGWHS
jgi:hypothetical protein